MSGTKSRNGLRKRAISSLGILRQLSRRPKEHCPIAVFCMTKARVEALAKAWAREFGTRASASASAQLELFDELTSLSNDLLLYVDNEFGIHTADLLEAERALVEDRLDRDQLTIVFATTTLAQGLNYSFQNGCFRPLVALEQRQACALPDPARRLSQHGGTCGPPGTRGGGLGTSDFFSRTRERPRCLPISLLRYRARLDRKDRSGFVRSRCTAGECCRCS